MKNQSEKTKTYSVKENPKYKDTLFRKVFTEKEDFNGNDGMEDRIELNLKEAFVNVEGLSPCVDLKAILLNINYGHIAKILEKRRKLQEYSIFVSEVKKGILKGYN